MTKLIMTVDKLKEAWGEKASALDCMALVKVDDPLGGLSFYVIAVDPVDENKLMCIVDSPVSVEVAEIDGNDLFNLYDTEGNFAHIDTNFRPQHAQTLYRRIREKHAT